MSPVAPETTQGRVAIIGEGVDPRLEPDMDVAQLASLYKDALKVRDKATRDALSGASATAAAAATALESAKPPTLGAKHTTTGDHVRRAQMLLAGRSIDVRVDGKFDRDTKDAVTAFQKGAGLQVTGVVDDSTWAALAGPHPAQGLTDAATTALETVQQALTDALGRGARSVSDATLRAVADEAARAETLAAESLAAEASAAEPLAAEPVGAEPLAAEPLAAEPLAAEALAAEPLTAEPLAAEPLAAEPLAAEPLAAEPLAAEPVAAEPVAAEPTGLENLAVENAVGENLAASNAAISDALQSFVSEHGTRG